MEEIGGVIKESVSEKEIEKRKGKLNKFLFGWVTDNYDRAFLVLLAVTVLVGIIVFYITKGQPLWYDSASFLSTAKKWALGLNSVNDIWYYRRGLFWVFFSAVFYKLGIGEIGIQFSGVLFYTGLVAVSYFLIRDMFNKKIALLSSTLMTFSWVLLFFIGRSMTEIPASFFLMLSVFLFWKGYVLKKGNKFLYLFAFFFGIAAFIRFQYMMFAPPILIYIFIDQKFKMFKDKRLWITLGVFLLTLLPHFIIYSLHYGNFFTDILTYYFGIGAQQAGIASSASTKTFSNFFDYFRDFPYLLTTVLLIPFIIGVFYFFSDMIIGIDKMFKDKEIQKKIFVFLWIVIPLIVLGRITDIVEQRYVIPAFSFLFLIIAVPFIKLEGIFIKNLKMKKRIALALSLLILLAAVIPGVVYANNLIDNKKTSYLEVEQSALWIKANSNPGDIVVSNSIPYFTYYAERATYPFQVSIWGGHYQNQDLVKYPEGEKGFDEFIKDKKPKYLMLSTSEVHEDWMYSYPQNHVDILKPVKAFYQNNQPVVIIYEFNYN